MKIGGNQLAKENDDSGGCCEWINECDALQFYRDQTINTYKAIHSFFHCCHYYCEACSPSSSWYACCTNIIVMAHVETWYILGILPNEHKIYIHKIPGCPTRYPLLNFMAYWQSCSVVDSMKSYCLSVSGKMTNGNFHEAVISHISIIILILYCVQIPFYIFFLKVNLHFYNCFQ